MADRPRRRTTFGPTLLLGLGGAALGLAGAAQPWAEATTRTPALRTVTADGTDVAALVLPLALVSLAAWGTVLVLRARGRRVVSLLGFAASLGAAVTVAATASSATGTAARLLGDVPTTSTSATAWPYVAGVGALLSAVAFVGALVKAPTWPEMSARYDAPAAGSAAAGRPSEELTDAELWNALDEGRDPTA
ncbi:MAG TPA: Trp biosynthesis-associated membrane protein [Marmoricola sp.]|nr:Trp biosynthesis-associated membrane protein [Marmoricola sp.]